MAENKMKEVAELLGIEMDKPFNIKGYAHNPCKLANDKIINNNGCVIPSRLFQLLTGEIEIEKPILDDVEKRYLENILRPFKNRVVYVEKIFRFGYEQIRYRVSLTVEEYGNELCELPSFDKGIIYKGMEYDKKYSIEELGLFEGDDE